jgi:hypothetical protein
MWKLEKEISDYPDDYKLFVEFSGTSVEFTNETDGQKLITFMLSVDEAIKAGELAKKFKEATRGNQS